MPQQQQQQQQQKDEMLPQDPDVDLFELLLPQRPEEVDLHALSEQSLQELAQAVKSYSRYSTECCIEALQRMQRFVRHDLPFVISEDADMTKAHNALNCLRARLLLLGRTQCSAGRVHMQSSADVRPSGNSSSRGIQAHGMCSCCSDACAGGAPDHAAAAAGSCSRQPSLACMSS
jgi:hypothetical protein